MGIFWIIWLSLVSIGLGGTLLTKSHQIVGEFLSKNSQVTKEFYIWGNQWSWIYFRHYYSIEETELLTNNSNPCAIGENSNGPYYNSSYLGITFIIKINSDESIINGTYGINKGDCINGKLVVYCETGTTLNLSVYRGIIHLIITIRTSLVDGYQYMIVQDASLNTFWYLEMYIALIGGVIIETILNAKLKNPPKITN